MDKYGFVYLWYDRKHKRYYVGCHWGTEDDGYVSSSVWMKASYKRRPQDFKRRVLETGIQVRNQLLEREYKWLKMIKNEELGTRYYNHHNHHFGHWSNADNANEVKKTVSEKTKDAMQREDVRLKYEDGLKKRDTKSSDPEVREKRRLSMLKTMEAKYPKEQRKKRMKFGSDEYNEFMKEHTTRMWANRDEEARSLIGSKISTSLKSKVL